MGLRLPFPFSIGQIPFQIAGAVRDAREQAAIRDELANAVAYDRDETLRQAGIRPEALRAGGTPFTPGAGPSMGELAGAVQQHPGQPPLERILHRTEQARPRPTDRFRQIISDPAVFASPEFDDLMARLSGGDDFTLGAGQGRFDASGRQIARNPFEPKTLSDGAMLVSETGSRLAENVEDYPDVVVPEGGALVTRGGAQSGEVRFKNPKTAAPGSGAAGAGKPPKPLTPSQQLDLRRKAREQAMSDEVAAGGIVDAGANGMWEIGPSGVATDWVPISPETRKRIAERERAYLEQAGILAPASAPAQSSAPTIQSEPAPSAPAAPAPAQAETEDVSPEELAARQALVDAGGDPVKAGELLRARGINF